MKVLICGSRDWEDGQKIAYRLLQFPKDTLIIAGQARGADALAESEALRYGYHCASVRPLWTHHGKGAGHRRNAAMLQLDPDLVIAFSTSTPPTPGTANMIKQAREQGVPVELHNAEGGVQTFEHTRE